MASIKRKNYAVEIVDNEGHIFLFPLNSIILAAEEKSDMVNIKLKSYRRTIMSLNYKTFTEPTADSAENLCKITEKIIYDI
jgi:hypothetical protein